MGFAFAHIVFIWLLGKSYEYVRKKSITRVQWVLLLFGSIIPDADYLLDWIFKVQIHRTFTHSFLMIFFSFVIIYTGCLIYNKSLDKKILGIFFTLGIFSHLILDMIFGSPGVRLLWPIQYSFWFFGFLKEYTFHELTREELLKRINWAIFDMSLGVFWIGYLFFKRKIKEF